MLNSRSRMDAYVELLSLPAATADAPSVLAAWAGVGDMRAAPASAMAAAATGTPSATIRRRSGRGGWWAGCVMALPCLSSGDRAGCAVQGEGGRFAGVAGV